MAVESENPSFRIGEQRPARTLGQLNPLEHKMLTRDQNRPLESQAGGMTWRPKREGVGDCYAIVYVQFTVSAVVEQAECRVAALLNLGEHDAGAERVDGAGRNEDDIALRNRTPLN